MLAILATALCMITVGVAFVAVKCLMYNEAVKKKTKKTTQRKITKSNFRSVKSRGSSFSCINLPRDPTTQKLLIVSDCSGSVNERTSPESSSQEASLEEINSVSAIDKKLEVLDHMKIVLEREKSRRLMKRELDGGKYLGDGDCSSTSLKKLKTEEDRKFLLAARESRRRFSTDISKRKMRFRNRKSRRYIDQKQIPISLNATSWISASLCSMITPFDPIKDKNPGIYTQEEWLEIISKAKSKAINCEELNEKNRSEFEIPPVKGMSDMNPQSYEHDKMLLKHRLHKQGNEASNSSSETGYQTSNNSSSNTEDARDRSNSKRTLVEAVETTHGNEKQNVPFFLESPDSPGRTNNELESDFNKTETQIKLLEEIHSLMRFCLHLLVSSIKNWPPMSETGSNIKDPFGYVAFSEKNPASKEADSPFAETTQEKENNGFVEREKLCEESEDKKKFAYENDTENSLDFKRTDTKQSHLSSLGEINYSVNEIDSLSNVQKSKNVDLPKVEKLSKFSKSSDFSLKRRSLYCEDSCKRLVILPRVRRKRSSLSSSMSEETSDERAPKSSVSSEDENDNMFEEQVDELANATEVITYLDPTKIYSVGSSQSPIIGISRSRGRNNSSGTPSPEDSSD